MKCQMFLQQCTLQLKVSITNQDTVKMTLEILGSGNPEVSLFCWCVNHIQFARSVSECDDFHLKD